MQSRTVGVMLAALFGWSCARATPAVKADAWPETSLSRAVAEEALRNAPLELAPDSPLLALKGRTFIFVAGFLNELIPGYFEDNASVVKELGAETITLAPNSFTEMGDEADRLHLEALNRFTFDGRPIVLVGHSMGGAASLLAVIRYPELILDGAVDRVVVIQGAVGGSPLADTLAHGPLTRIGGLRTLTRAEAAGLFERELATLRTKRSPEEVERLFQHVFYVRSYREHEVARELAMSRLFLSAFGSGENDGLMLQEDMKLPVGVDLGVVEADHAGLTVSSGLARSSKLQRQAFTRALLRVIYAAPISTP